MVEGAAGPPAERPEAVPSGEGMQTLMRDLEQEFRSPRRGDVINGVVVRVDQDGILVDIGTKSEGFVPSHEAERSRALGNEIKVGDAVLVYVLQSEGQEGRTILSLNRARAERGWHSVQRQFEGNELLEAEVIDYNKGGLVVSVSGLRGFVPMSQVVGLRGPSVPPEEAESRLKALVGERIPLKILEINRRRNRLILSERAALQERRSQRKEQLLAELQEGQIRRGRVSSLCAFGAFIDLGGADGLAHISELSWGPVAHPSEILKVGDEVEVCVLGVDRERKKIALSLRRAQPEPWSRVAEKYTVGEVVRATITKLASFGAFAQLERGVEGLIHISELAEGRVAHPKQVVKEGDQVNVRILRIELEKRRIGLSLRGVDQLPTATEEKPPAVPQPVSWEETPEAQAAAPREEEDRGPTPFIIP